MSARLPPSINVSGAFLAISFQRGSVISELVAQIKASHCRFRDGEGGLIDQTFITK